MLLRSKGEAHRNRHFSSKKDDNIFYNFDQIKVIIVYSHICMEDEITLTFPSRHIRKYKKMKKPNRLKFTRVMEDAMEDGSWVLISNVGGELWNFVSFKLYQICLGAKLNQNFRLNIIFHYFRVENYILMFFRKIFLRPNLMNLKGPNHRRKLQVQISKYW